MSAEVLERINELQDAGLYHAAYGTSAFEQNVFELSQREEVAAVIGSDSENIVYHYCACDRDAFFTQFGQVDKPVFYDRLTTEKLVISSELLQQLCELTAANEIEIARKHFKTSFANVFCVCSRSSLFSCVSELPHTAHDCSRTERQNTVHKWTISTIEAPNPCTPLKHKQLTIVIP